VTRLDRTPGDVVVTVKGKNMTVAPAMRKFVVSKMARLDRYLDRLETIEIELATEKTRETSSQNHVEASARVAGKTIRVVARNADMRSAVDEAVDKLYRQLNRRKERLKSHYPERPAGRLPLAEIEELPEEFAPDESTPGKRPAAIEIERLSLEPMFVDEAVAEIRATGYGFYVFLNAHNEHVNVLYRRGDGSLGLIEPSVT
jgi:putative sigma-54 modulation protein